MIKSTLVRRSDAEIQVSECVVQTLLKSSVGRSMDVLIGLDPGGNRNFGWCIAADSMELPLSVIASGLSNDAHSAISSVIKAMPEQGNPLAAGVDSPLFWSRRGARKADVVVRNAIRDAGAPYSSGTVQDVNSLRGACLAQGMLAAIRLREIFPTLPITESHPKALRWLLPETQAIAASSEHQRDALLSAIAAWATAHGPAGWSDLYPLEPYPYTPVAAPLHYFTPGVPLGNSFKSTP